MELVKFGLAANRESGPGLAHNSVEELCHLGGGKEDDGLGEFRVGELVVGK